MVLENVSTLIRKVMTVLVFNNQTVIQMTTRCFGAGTKCPWVAGIDIYVMVTECVLPRLIILLIIRFRLHIIIMTNMLKDLTYSIHWLILDSTLLRMIMKNASPFKETRIKTEPKFGPMIAILRRRVSAGNGKICNHYVSDIGIWKCKLYLFQFYFKRFKLADKNIHYNKDLLHIFKSLCVLVVMGKKINTKFLRLNLTCTLIFFTNI